MIFNGLEIMTSIWLTEPGEPYQVRRPWRSRLFSRPWRPFVATVTVIPQVPSRQILQFSATKYVVHPTMLDELRRQLAAPPVKDPL